MLLEISGVSQMTYVVWEFHHIFRKQYCKRPNWDVCEPTYESHIAWKMSKNEISICQVHKCSLFLAIGLSSLLAPRYPCDLMLGGSRPRNHLAKTKKKMFSLSQLIQREFSHSFFLKNLKFIYWNLFSVSNRDIQDSNPLHPIVTIQSNK